MPRDYNKLLILAYEIEGLLTLQAQRGDNAVAAIDELINVKIADLVSQFSPRTEADTSVASDEDDTRVASDQEETATSALDEEEMMAEQPAPSQPMADQEDEDPVETPTVNAEIKEPVKAAEFPETEATLTLDEKLARQRAKDLSRAFTLNDKFRFRRELFRGSQEELDDAINVISQMTTVAEAEEYMYDDLCMDPENDDVKAFMDIIVKHF